MQSRAGPGPSAHSQAAVGVAMSALLMRARDLGVMPTATYLQAMRTMSARCWRRDEPGSLGLAESPSVLNKAIGTAGLQPEDVAAETGWPSEMIAQLLASHFGPALEPCFSGQAPWRAA